MWRGSITFETPLIWSLGFLITFVFGGLTGVILASPPLDFHVSDTYFVVAHFHYVVFGTVVFAMFAGFYFWWPKWTGKMLNETLGKWHFWLLFIGFHTTFLVQHWLGVVAMPRRYYSYLPEDNITWMNQLSTIGAGILAISLIPFFLNVYITARKAPKVTVNDPWGYGGSLEWATSCPPPRHNFTSIPRIRSERPAFDLNHPEAGVPVASDPPRMPLRLRCTTPPRRRSSNARQCRPLLDPRGLPRSHRRRLRCVDRSERHRGERRSRVGRHDRDLARGDPVRLHRVLPRTRAQGAGAELPEDRLDANIDDGDPELGFFSRGAGGRSCSPVRRRSASSASRSASGSRSSRSRWC